MCQIVLPGPEAAARAAAAAPAKKRNEAEAAIADAVSKALHILGSLKQMVSLLAGPSTALNAVGKCCKPITAIVLTEFTLTRAT